MWYTYTVKASKTNIIYVSISWDLISATCEHIRTTRNRILVQWDMNAEFWTFFPDTPTRCIIGAVYMERALPEYYTKCKHLWKHSNACAILFHNHPQRNMKRKFHDFLTLLAVDRKTVDSSGIWTRTFGKCWILKTVDSSGIWTRTFGNTARLNSFSVDVSSVRKSWSFSSCAITDAISFLVHAILSSMHLYHRYVQSNF